MKCVSDFKAWKNKKVLARVDFDVPISEQGVPQDLSRIIACLPTIKFLLKEGALVTLVTKLGDPEKKKISTKVLLEPLEKMLIREIHFIPDFDKFGDGKTEISLFENIRFFDGETLPSEPFAKILVKHFDIFVNEAFAMGHRTDASVSLVPRYLPAFAGFRLVEEVKNLSSLLDCPQRPFVAIMGGAKIETKLPVIEHLAKIADKVLLGGKLGLEWSGGDKNVIVPTDYLDQKDIGPKTIALFKAHLLTAKTIVWNGPLGVFEDEKYEKGTKEIALFVASLVSKKVVGGGDTISALNKFEVLEKMDFVSMGGGAMLKFLSGENLPGLKYLAPRRNWG